jgi:tRNA-Thr(GGU) m(6)t(6)A37 methyltransferase TsaA
VIVERTISIVYMPVGFVRSPFKDPEGTPISPSGGGGVAGTVEVLPEFAEGLRDLEGFSHITLVYHLHLSRGFSLTVTPFLDDTPRGVFATRAPRRPNPIGISTVRLLAVEGATLRIEDLDIVDGTPVLDIKPYVPEFDERTDVRIGWLSGRASSARATRADGRFRRDDPGDRGPQDRP